MPLFSSLPFCEVMRTVYQLVYLLGVGNKLSTGFFICKAMRTPYQPVSVSMRLCELFNNLLCSYEAVRTPYQFVSLSARPWELHINLSVCLWGGENSLSICLFIRETMRTPYQPVCLPVKWWELLFVSLSARPWEFHINLSACEEVRTRYKLVFVSVTHWELPIN
jgi:hypothetical protein